MGEPKRAVAELEEENRRLREELIEVYEDVMRDYGHLVRLSDDYNKKYEGYYGTLANRSAYAAGERLVNLGVWEKHWEGVGLCQFFRPIKRQKEQILAKASYTPSLKARDKIKKNCDGCQRSQESKIPFHGPLPAIKKRGE